MKKIYTLLSLILFSIPQIFAVTLADENINGVDRYAIYIGANDGGKGREKLLYAGSDALSFKQTMAEIGGVTEANSRTLMEPSKEAIDKALQEVTEEINKNSGHSKRSEFIFYYSGHSDENALLLGNTKYDYSTLKAAISAVPSDIHVVILDSCFSGNFIRTKGGQKRKPFLVDDSSIVTGHAYLSSSSDNESSQESDEIESSYFTNAMITGLRGAADTSGDNKVTLNELYSYAFNDTLSKTETSKAGPQHPNYNITLVGSGDLVLSDISAGESMLSISKDAKGKFIIRDSNDKLISEINKLPGQPIFMALPAGRYSAIIIEEYSTKQGTFELSKDQIYVLDQNSLTTLKRKTTRLRGDPIPLEDDDIEDFDDDDGEILENDFDKDDNNEILGTDDLEQPNYESKKWINMNQFFKSEDNKVIQVGLVPGFNFVNPHANTVNFAFGILGNTTHNVRGLQISSLINISNGNILGLQATAIGNILTGDLLGVQDAGLFNIANNVSGNQSAGLFNIAERVQGVQAAGIFNLADGIRGLQLAGIYSSSHYVQGAQISGIINIADNVNGLQMAGIVNVGKTVHGAQIGLINIAEKNDGIAIGLFNYIKDGVHEIGYAYDVDNMFDLFIKTGTHHLFFTLGNMCEDEDFFVDRDLMIVYGGIGTEIETDVLRISFEALSKYVYLFDHSYYSDETFREWFIPSCRITTTMDFSILTLFAGFSFDFFIPDYNDYAYAVYGYNKRWLWDFDDCYISPSIQIGLGIKF